MRRKRILATIKRTVIIAVAFYIAFYCGAMFNFFPFFADQLIASEIGYCSFLVVIFHAVISCLPSISDRLNKQGFEPQDGETVEPVTIADGDVHNATRGNTIDR